MPGPGDASRDAPRLRAAGFLAVLTACLALAWPATSSAVAPKTITIAATTPHAGNCWPFGEASNPSDDWRPYFGFVYQNIPPFDLKPADTLAFDLSLANDHDIQLDVAMAPAANGTDNNTAPFTTIVHNTQTPANPRGDATAGNYELAFTAQVPFSFAGGGLIIRVSNPGTSFITDQTCEVQLVGAASGSDPS